MRFNLILILLIGSVHLKAQEISANLKLQKSIGLYWENGFSVEFCDSALFNEKLRLGLSYASSNLGSAISSNAINQHQFLLSADYPWLKQKLIKPITKLNIGYFTCNYGDPIFDVLPNKSLLLSFEFGGECIVYQNIYIRSAFGYNLISGNGIDTPGTIYPTFLNNNIGWKF